MYFHLSATKNLYCVNVFEQIKSEIIDSIDFGLSKEKKELERKEIEWKYFEVIGNFLIRFFKTE